MDMNGEWLSRQADRLQRVPLGILAAVLLLSLAAMLVIYGKLQSYETVLKGSPPDQQVPSGKEWGQAGGIVGLELAFTVERARSLRNRWEASGSEVCPPTVQRAPSGQPSLLSCAKASVKLDVGFILVYSVFGAALVLLLLRVLGVPIDGFWTVMAGLPLMAGAADLVENAFLWSVLNAAAERFTVLGAGLFALLKFYLIGLALLAALTVISFWLFSRSAQRTTGEKPPYLLTLAQVIEREKLYLRSRRRKAEVPHEHDPAPIGLALSGGGIRSATLGLGAVQTLTGSRLFPRIDYLSTVSGGGYLGTALSSLLSCKELNRDLKPDDPDQYRFGPGDRPHFSGSAPADSPFYDDQRPPSAPHRQWLSGRMVVQHLRAFGEYLVRRRRALDRDMLRALGIVLTGIFSTLLFFVHLLLIGAAIALLALAVTGGELFSTLGKDGLLGYLGSLVAGAGGPVALVWAAALGALFAVGAGVVCGECADRTPRIWFRRTGDTDEESRQYRALWVLGILAVPLAFASPAVLGPFRPEMDNGLLLPAFFFLGGFVASSLAYVVLVALAPGKPELRSSRNSRSFVGAIIGLFLYFLLAASVLVALTAALGALAGTGKPTVHADALAGGGSAALIGAVVSGLLAWWRSRKEESKRVVKPLIGWVRRSADFIQKLALGLAVFVVIIAGLACALVLVEGVLRWYGAGEPAAAHYLAFTAAAATLLLILGFAIDFNVIVQIPPIPHGDGFR